MFEFLKRRLIGEEWNMAFRLKENHSDCILKNKNYEFTIIKNTWRYWCADPFLLENEEKTFIFFEMFDRLKLKGVIACSEIKDDKPQKPKIVMEQPYHLSYPNVFKVGDKIYMVPETNKAEKIQVFEAILFPAQWKLIDVLIDDIVGCDTTFLLKDDKLWLFTLQVQGNNVLNDKLLLFYKDNPTNKWLSHKKNPITNDVLQARPAGKIFYYNNMIIRPSQDCNESYGAALNFNKIEEVSQDEYIETLFMKLTPSLLKLNDRYKVTGVHTYNSSSKYEIIDIKRTKIDFISAISHIVFSIKRKVINFFC